MSESESFGSAKEDDNFDALDTSKDESEDEPLSKKKKTKKTTPNKLKSAKKNGKKEKKVKPKRGRPKKAKVSSAPDPLEDTNDKSEEEYEVSVCLWCKRSSCNPLFYLLGASDCWASTIQRKACVQDQMEGI